MFLRVWNEILYERKKLTKEHWISLVMFFVYGGMNLGIDVRTGEGITWMLPWIAVFFLFFVYCPEYFGGLGKDTQPESVALSEVFYYVPHKNGGIRHYMCCKIWAMTIYNLFFFFVTAGIYICINSLIIGRVPEYMIIDGACLITLVLFVIFVIRLQLAWLNRQVTGKALFTKHRFVKILHGILITLNVIGLLFSNGEISIYGNTLEGLQVDTWIILGITVAGVVHIIWYFRYTLDTVAGKPVHIHE